jgi:competence protein ComEC
MFGCGILLFFYAPFDPQPTTAIIAFCLFAGIAWSGRNRPALGPLLLGATIAAGGFSCAALRIEYVKAPILDRPARATVTGLVQRVETRARGYRLVVLVESFDSRARVTPPKLLRAIVSRKGTEPPIGARIALTGLWRPPPGAVRPAGYDWSRDAFFLGIGAVGQADDPPRVIEANPPLSLALSFNKKVAETRAAIGARITSILTGTTGAIAASLVVGERGNIPEAINEAMRISGLSHVLSISGLHMALFAGAVFWTIRLVLAAWPRVVLNHPIKKWAAVAAIFAAYGYLLLAGAEIAAQRSFLMAALAFLAIALDRSAISLRSVALSAMILMAWAPEVLLSISFQMSFAAVLALIAFYDFWKHRTKKPQEEWETSSKLRRYVVLPLVAMAITTLIAGLATAPFGAFYFQRSGIYSLLANLMALPLVSFVIMPAAVIGLIAVPFGLDGPVWYVMGYGIDGMVAIARFVASLPGAAVYSPAFAASAFLLMVIALIWLCLWRTQLRLLGLLPLSLSFVVLMFGQRADIYIEPEGRAMAVRHPDGALRITGMRFARFAAANWLAADGDEREVSDRSVTSDVRCDRTACRLTLPDGRDAVLAWTYQALATDCARADLVVTRLVAPPSCRKSTTVIDAHDLAARGAMTISLSGGGFEMTSAREPNENRYWFNRPSVRGPLFKALPDPPAAPDVAEDPADPPVDRPDDVDQ